METGILLVALLLGGIITLVWAGLQSEPASFRRFPRRVPWPETAGGRGAALPENLPAPVERFYRALYGSAEVPVITSAVITGRAQLRFGKIRCWSRFRFVQEAGRAYHHDIHVTWFGIPVLRVKELYRGGQCRIELAGVGGERVIENKPKVNQGANLALWGEAIWTPSLFVTDPRVRWEAVDDATALLVVPASASEASASEGGNEERFVVRFDAATGLPHLFEALRYKGEADAEKTLWLAECRAWGGVSGQKVPLLAALTWYGDGAPWAVFRAEDVAYNEDVSCCLCRLEQGDGDPECAYTRKNKE